MFHNCRDILTFQNTNITGGGGGGRRMEQNESGGAKQVIGHFSM